nr:hypothetical protein CcurKRNrm3_p020 [Cryptomonas curvata]
MNKKLSYLKKFINFKIKNFYCYCIFKYTSRKVNSKFFLIRRKYIKEKKLSIKMLKQKLNEVFRAFCLAYIKKSQSKLDMTSNLLKYILIYFFKKNWKQYVFISKSFNQVTYFSQIKNFYLIYLSKFYFKEKKFFIIINILYKCFLYIIKIFTHDLFKFIIKTIFLTTGI